MTDRACVLCMVYRPDKQPRSTERPPVCEHDRSRLVRELAAVGAMHDRLVNPPPIDADRRRANVLDKQGRPTGELRWRDPVAAVLPVDSIRNGVGAPPVSGSREALVPVNLTALDLTGAARRPNPTADARAHPEDQIGRLSVATALDSWVRDWRDLLYRDHRLPVPVVPTLSAWLSNRIDDACDRHPIIADFAAELRDLASALRGALGETEPRPVLLDGIPCRKCDLVSLLRRPGDEYIDCDGCGLLYTEGEYREWVGRLYGYEKSIRTPDEVQELLSAPIPRAAQHAG